MHCVLCSTVLLVNFTVMEQVGSVAFCKFHKIVLLLLFIARLSYNRVQGEKIYSSE